MTKPISSFPEHQRLAVAKRRAEASQDGLGKVSAQNYLKRHEKSENKKSSQSDRG